jgi:hypothetical protein
MEIGELPRSIALSVAVIDGRRLAGDEGKLARSTSAGSQDRFGERGEEGLTRERSPYSDVVRAEEGSDGSGIRRLMVVARVPERDGASTATSWWCRLDWRRVGAARCRWRPCRSWTGHRLVLLAAGSSRCSRRRRWREPLGGRTARRCSDGLRTATQVWRSGAGSAFGRAGSNRSVGPVLDRGRAAGSRMH